MLGRTSGEHQVEPPAQSSSDEHIAQDCVKLSFEYFQIYRFYNLCRPLERVCLLPTLSCYMIVDSSKMLPKLSEGWTNLNSVFSASLSASHVLSCGSSGELSAEITLVYQCLSSTGEPKIGLLVWSVTVTAHSVSCCAADKLLSPKVSHAISLAWDLAIMQLPAVTVTGTWA